MCEHNNDCLYCGQCVSCDPHSPCMRAIAPDGSYHYTKADRERDELLARVSEQTGKCHYCTKGRWKNPQTGQIEQCKNCRGTGVTRKHEQ